ncbi:MAG: homoserine kinase [Flavobacteriales bacterium]|nr:homoserine kinase [Flavobacteriales bacterium]
MKNKSVKVFAPASVANMGAGFDVMGMALDGVGDVLEMSVEEGDGLVIENHSGVDLPADVEKNVITPVVRSFMKELGKKAMIHIKVVSKILPGSGIGSSAASSSAAAWGMNELFGRPFSEEKLVEFAMEGEALLSGTRHADNVAPALLGGVVFMRGYEPLDMVRLPVPENFWCSVVHPHITVKTAEARAVLPEEIPLRTAVKQWGNVGGLVAGFALKDMGLISRSMVDVVVEPHRKRFIPSYDTLKENLMASGALAANISGSGPSVFAVCDCREKAEELSRVMKQHFDALGIENDVYVSHVLPQGARTLE